MKGVNPPSGTRRGRPRNAATAEAERFSTDGQPQGGKSEACCAVSNKIKVGPSRPNDLLKKDFSVQ